MGDERQLAVVGRHAWIAGQDRGAGSGALDRRTPVIRRHVAPNILVAVRVVVEAHRLVGRAVGRHFQSKGSVHRFQPRGFLPQLHRQKVVQAVVKSVRHRQRPGLDDEPDALLAHCLRQQIKKFRPEDARRGIAQDDGVVLGELLQRLGKSPSLLLGGVGPPFRLEDDVRRRRAAAAQPVVAPHGVLQETEVPTRQALDIEHAELFLADANISGVGVVRSQLFRFLRQRRHLHREIMGARLRRLERQFDLLLLRAPKHEVLGIEQLVAVAELDLDRPFLEALRFDRDSNAGGVTDGNQARRKDIDDGDILEPGR